MESRYNAIRRVSETQSESSSIATELSENEIAVRLGLPDSSSLETVRFKVDRKKLEEMIQSAQAITFFESLMKETTTHIYWPSHLKIDAKSKKDVHVKILGKTEDVKIAKERVLQKLDARGSRVTMKMDISYNDHSSIIGTGGNNIKKIMDETSTHIHFPDSNIDKDKESKELAKRFSMLCKSNQNPYSCLEGMNKPLSLNKSFQPKSNQVSLNGTLEGVEKARAAVRSTSPLTISFETPVSQIQKPSAATESDIEKVKQKFGVTVVLKSTRQKLHSTTVMVKGTEKNAKQVEQATIILINSMCDTLANQTKVCLQMEISIQHHESIKGVSGNNLRQIMEETKTTIIFPDCKDGNTPQPKKTHVTIKGCLKGVYIAKQQLIGNLLVTLSFDYSDFSLSKVDIDELSKKYGVLITWREKSKHGSKSISIKGKEKFIDKIYEARHELLKLTTPLIKADIPEAYFSKTDHDEFAFRHQLVLMSNSAESPLAHYNLGQNFSTQFDAFQNVTSPSLSRMQNMQNRQRMNQNNFNNNFLSPHSNLSQRNSVSPTTPLTSGYNSAHNSFSSSSSLDPQMNIFQQPQNTFLDRDALMAEANSLAMRRALDGEEIRTPTSTWSGLGLSRTSPFCLESSVRKPNSWENNEASPFSLAKTSGFFDSANALPSHMLLGQHKDLQSLLVSLGLEHYINTFLVNEIGLEIFATLTPEDLTTLGIQAFGARKKLLMAIHQLNESKLNMSRLTKFSGSAAPGAERHSSKTRTQNMILK
ncbi:Protein bicaudal C, partial [Pseudolycoriella hygida]